MAITTPFDSSFVFLLEDVTKEDIAKAKEEYIQAKKDMRKRLHMQHVSDHHKFSKEENDWYNKYSAVDISNKLFHAENHYQKLQQQYAHQNGQEAIAKRKESMEKFKKSAIDKKDEIRKKLSDIHQSSKVGSPRVQEDTSFVFEVATSFIDMINAYDFLIALENENYQFGENKELLFSLTEKSIFELAEEFDEAERITNTTSQLYQEAALSSKQRRALDDSEFGLPEDRAYPLIDESHVRQAIAFFNKCDSSKQKKLAKNIILAMKKFDMIDKVKVSEKNAFYKYYRDRERYIKENFDIYPFPTNGVATEFSVGAMLPQIPLSGTPITKTDEPHVSFYDNIEVQGELSDDPRLIGSFSAEEKVLMDLDDELSLFLESDKSVDSKDKSFVEKIKEKFQELINKIETALAKFLENGGDTTNQELEEIQKKYPQILKDHPELANVDLSDHFHNKNLSIRDTAKYEKSVRQLIDKYANSNMTEEKFNREFDKIRKKYLKETKQIFRYEIKNSGEPTGKILLKGLMNMLPTIIKLAGAAYLMKQSKTFVEDVSKKFDASALKVGLDKTEDLVKKASGAVKAATTVAKDIVTEGSSREQVKKKVAKEFKGMMRFYGDIGKNVVGATKSKAKPTKESTEDLYIESTNYDIYVDIMNERYDEIKKKIENADITSSKRAQAKITLEENYKKAQAFFDNMKNNTSLLTSFKRLLDRKGKLSKKRIQSLFDDYLLLSDEELMNIEFQKAQIEKLKSETVNEDRKTAIQLATLMTVNSAAKKVANSYAIESVLSLPKKNVIFESELKKIADGIKVFIDENISTDKLITHGMNFKKTVCTFHLPSDVDGHDVSKVESKIKSLGFKEVDDKDLTSIYEKEVKNILITLTYDTAMDKIKVTYELMVQNTNESVEDGFVFEADSIDSDMKSIVSKLNQKGYHTKYSCSGHTKTRIKEDGYRDGIYHGKLYSTARIVFTNDYTVGAPDKWKSRILNGDKLAIYVNPKTYMPKDGNPDQAFETWKKEYMDSLRKWVDELPVRSRPTSESVTDDVENLIFEDMILL